MLKIVCLGMFIFLAAIGITEIIKFLSLKITVQGSHKKNSTIVMPISGHNEKIEFLIRSEIYKIIWEDRGSRTNIICLDCGMDFETRKICELFCKDYGFIKLYDMNDIKPEILSEYNTNYEKIS